MRRRSPQPPKELWRLLRSHADTLTQEGCWKLFTLDVKFKRFPKDETAYYAEEWPQ